MLQVDALNVGLGTVPIQKDSQGRCRPVVFASKSITPAETRYVNIECEMLAVVLAAWGFITTIMVESTYARVTTSLLMTFWSILVMLHQGCKGYCLRYNYIILPLNMFQVKTSEWKMHSTESAQMRRKKSKTLMSPSMNSPHTNPGYKMSPSRRQHNRTRHFSHLFDRCWKVG